MSDAKTSNAILPSILSGIILAALTGVATMQIKNGEKLSDIRAAMMPREEVEIRLHQFALDLKALEAAYYSSRQLQESVNQATTLAISEIRFRMENTVRTRTQ